MAVQAAPVNGAADIDKLKLEWTARQLELAQQAIFDDHELDFECQQDDQASAEVDDFAVPRCRHVNTKLTGLTTIAGLDISFFPDRADQAIVAVAVLSYPDMKLLFSAIKYVTLRAPYIPSFLSMREAEHMVNLIDHLRGIPECPFPQVFLIDGNGQLHERQAGLATVVGVLANVPTIGVAKDYHPLHAADGQAEAQWRFEQKAFKRKCREVLRERGDWMGIFDAARKQYGGGALLTSPATNAKSPVFVSPGHRVSLNTALAVTVACSTSARVSEPIRQADRISRDAVSNATTVAAT